MHSDRHDEPGSGDPAGTGTDSSLMWAMIACCLAIPVLLILGVVTGAGFMGAGGWVIVLAGAAVVTVMLLIARQRAVGSRRGSSWGSDA